MSSLMLCITKKFSESKCDLEFIVKQYIATNFADMFYHCIVIIQESTTGIASTLDDTTFFSMPVTKNRHTEISLYQRTKNDDKSIAVVSVTAVSSVVILLTFVITKLRCKTNNDIIYYNHGTRHHRLLDHSQVPLRNFETDVYMEIEEMGEIKEIINTSSEKLQRNKVGVMKGKRSYIFSKSKPDSLQMRGESSSRTNFNNTLEPKTDSLIKETKSVKKIEKYKTYTTRRLLYSRINMKRYNSWHDVKDLPEILNYLNKSRCDLNVFYFKA